MGTWGAGAFENDAALDVYGNHVATMLKWVGEVAESPKTEIEDLDGPLAQVAMLAALAEHCKRIRLEKAKVDGWRKRFLQIFDDEIEELDAAPAFVAGRRKAIEDAFERLAQHIYDESTAVIRPAPAKKGSLNVTRALPEKKMKPVAAAAKKAGVKRGAKKKVGHGR